VVAEVGPSSGCANHHCFEYLHCCAIPVFAGFNSRQVNPELNKPRCLPARPLSAVGGKMLWMLQRVCPVITLPESQNVHLNQSAPLQSHYSRGCDYSPSLGLLTRQGKDMPISKTSATQQHKTHNSTAKKQQLVKSDYSEPSASGQKVGSEYIGVSGHHIKRPSPPAHGPVKARQQNPVRSSRPPQP